MFQSLLSFSRKRATLLGCRPKIGDILHHSQTEQEPAGGATGETDSRGESGRAHTGGLRKVSLGGIVSSYFTRPSGWPYDDFYHLGDVPENDFQPCGRDLRACFK